MQIAHQFGRLVLLALKTLALVFALSAGSALAQERVMIVLDGSGSMWGQIDGVPKLSIARKVLYDVLPTMDASTELGLVGYGHREKGNCGDIELIVAPAQGTAGAIADAAEDMRFLGKTPLSDAVQFAAEELRYTEDKATVVLITDGIETCEADPCALGSALEDQGIDFTAHVLGFGLSAEEGAQVACLAENTGGQYIEAQNSNELANAIQDVVMDDTLETAAVEITPVETPFASVSGPKSVVQGNNFSVGFEGPIEDRDYVTIVPVGSDPETYLSYDYVKNGNPAELVAPGDVGAYEIRYFHAASDAVAATSNIQVIEADATLQAETEVQIGAEFEVEWKGPDGVGDYITIVPRGADEGEYLSYFYSKNDNPGELVAPGEPGAYELRYVLGVDDLTLARREILVVDVEVGLSAPQTVMAGTRFEVSWKGPNGQRDYITIVEPDAREGSYDSYFYTANENPGELIAPADAGAFEIRYVLGVSDASLATKSINVVPAVATLSLEGKASTGGELTVTWEGPNGPRDYVTVVPLDADEGSYTDYFYTRNANPGEIDLPDEPGRYEIRYVLGVDERTLVSEEIRIK